jgi:hypothetical protein
MIVTSFSWAYAALQRYGEKWANTNITFSNNDTILQICLFFPKNGRASNKKNTLKAFYLERAGTGQESCPNTIS